MEIPVSSSKMPRGCDLLSDEPSRVGFPQTSIIISPFLSQEREFEVINPLFSAFWTVQIL
jgi:hypothetical protein